ncbi:MAG TPA: substrate-binding domain-containing protein [Caldilineaceae bacterium]|nr:substrate-binding domain-containing protein [Caldilineaceae bacterium]
MPAKLNRRTFLHLAAASAGTTLIAACAAPVAPSASSTGDEAAPSGGTATLQIWTYPRTENDAEIVYKPMMEKFHELHPDIETQIEVQPWGGRREKLYAAAAAGEAPDIWFATTDTVPAYIEKGVILPLSDLLTPEEIAHYSEAELDAASLDGVLYMPLTEGEVNGIAYNGAILRELGHDPATAKFETWDELYGLAEQAKSQGYYLEAISTMNWTEWLTTVHEAGGSVYTEDRTRSRMTEQPAIDALTRWVTEYQSGWVPLEFAIGSDDESEGLPDYWLALEQATNRVEDAACVQDVEANPDLEFVHGHPRRKDASFEVVSGIVSGQGWAITQQSDQVDAALTWVRFMITPENIAMYCNLSGATPVSEAAKALWQPDPCVLEHVNRFAPHLFAGVDTNTLWQESKVVCGPHFQAAVLGQETVEQALEAIDAELNALLAEKYG